MQKYLRTGVMCLYIEREAYAKPSDSNYGI